MIEFFPLDQPVFSHQFGIAAWPSESAFVKAPTAYGPQIGIRRNLLAGPFRQSYLTTGAVNDQTLQEAVNLLIDRSDFLTRQSSGADQFVINEQDARRTTQRSVIDLSWLGQNLTQDVVLVSGDADLGFPLIAGCVCFPSGWTIREKLGQSILAIHQDVPDFHSHLFAATEKLFRRMRPLRTTWRTNWGVRPSAQLDQSPRHAGWLQRQRDGITARNALAQCFFRVEFQTLTRLPSNDILFTIQTDQCCLGSLTPGQRMNLKGVLESCPLETLRYKGILPMRDVILEALN